MVKNRTTALFRHVVSFKIQKWLAANPSVNRWAGLKRDPDNAARRRHLKQVVEQLATEHRAEALVKAPRPHHE